MTHLIVGYGLGSGYPNEVADEEARARTWAQSADYSLPGGESYTPSNVNRLRRLHNADAGHELARLWFAQEGPLAEKLVCSYGPDADIIVSRLAAEQRYEPRRLVPVVERGMPEVASPVLSRRPVLASLLGVLVLFGEVHVSTWAHLYSDSQQQSLVRAFVRRQLVDIHVEGHHTSIPASERPGQDEAAATAVALHAILRAHDEGTVSDDRLRTVAARRAARGWMREYEGLVYREIAHKLNAANFPTRGRHGRWHESSARELVWGEEQ